MPSTRTPTRDEMWATVPPPKHAPPRDGNRRVVAFRAPYRSDGAVHVAVRWIALVLITLTLFTLLALYLNYVLRLPGPEWIAARWLILGSFAVWLLGRPILVCCAAVRYP